MYWLESWTIGSNPVKLILRLRVVELYSLVNTAIISDVIISYK